MTSDLDNEEPSELCQMDSRTGMDITEQLMVWDFFAGPERQQSRDVEGGKNALKTLPKDNEESNEDLVLLSIQHDSTRAQTVPAKAGTVNPRDFAHSADVSRVETSADTSHHRLFPSYLPRLAGREIRSGTTAKTRPGPGVGLDPDSQPHRPQKCPISTCRNHSEGFVRRYNQQRHILTHYHGEMTCVFCSIDNGEHTKAFARIDELKRHLATTHGAAQKATRSVQPDTTREKSNDESGGKTGQCSVCSTVFDSAQAFYDHLDLCIARAVREQGEQARCPRRAYTCQFIECASAGVQFEAWEDFLRHVRTQHDMFKCPRQGCDRAFTKLDKMIEHQREVHAATVPRRPQRPQVQVSAAVE